MRIILVLSTLILAALFSLVVACKSHTTKEYPITLTIRNDSKHKLNWVKVIWPSGGILSEGILFPGISHARLDYSWPEPPMTNFTLTFIEYGSQGEFNPNGPGTGFEKDPKVYRINVSLEDVNKKITTGTIKEVLVRILDFDKAEISCN